MRTEVGFRITHTQEDYACLSDKTSPEFPKYEGDQVELKCLGSSQVQYFLVKHPAVRELMDLTLTAQFHAPLCYESKRETNCSSFAGDLYVACRGPPVSGELFLCSAGQTYL